MKATRKNMPWLEEFTKEDLIEYIRSDFHFQVQPIRKSRLLFAKWVKKSREMEEKQRRHSDDLRNCDAKKRDALAVKFNASTDWNEKSLLLKQMEPYDNRLKKWLEDGKKLEKEEDAINKLYKDYEAAHEAERASEKGARK